MTFFLAAVFFIIGCSSSGGTAGFSSEIAEYPDLAYIRGGTFIMGSPASETGRYDNELQHQVTLRSFYLGKYEVRQSEYAEVMETNPPNPSRRNMPADHVSWYDAITYCNRRSVKEGLTPAYTIEGTEARWNAQSDGYRLPTEAEWEYACRAGTVTRFSTGDDSRSLEGNANAADLTAKETYPAWEIDDFRDGYAETAPAGSFSPNPWGLYDMHGNLWEWCWDRYGDYSADPQSDPSGPSAGSSRVIRGGGWSNFSRSLRSAYRGHSAPTTKSATVGFRIARDLPHS
ncbi:MAG: formylglycine-generating enzyme family protein [Spirochaetaceae bacterium]|jgi:formylglycine-generating enzyme required for sulfatase activity|nr:formylglycine-generating enzyme family protein [Spirochaetaceae bacterium]